MDKNKLLQAILVFILPFGLYLRTLSPTYLPIDSAEFSLCMHFWGVCHPPGFPLYTLIGKIFTTFWPFGSLIYKANLLSAIFSALTVSLVYLVLRELKVKALIAILTALFLSVSSIFWEFSVSADVFSFATFLIALTILLVFKNKAFWAFFTLGLSASHFYISAILYPVIYWYFWGFKFNPKLVGQSVVVFMTAFFGQVLMYFRMIENPVISWGHVQNIADFINFVRRKEFGSIFLIANPILTFSIIKLFKHFYVYFLNLATNFGIILPFLSLWPILTKLGNRKILFLTACYFVILVIQLTLLSTIDPTGKDNPFQINKFYLSSFVFVTILTGIAINLLVEKIFANETIYPAIILSILILISIAVNFRSHDFSKNYFSQNLVFDALGQLPADSIAITIDHVFYFGSLYEQKISNKFTDIDVLYFPNEKNLDSEKYKPQFFINEIDYNLVDSISEGKKLGKAEAYILQTIARNLDTPIYVLQGEFEENFFAYLKPNLRPYGLWWKFEPDPKTEHDFQESYRLFENALNKDIKKSNFHQAQQQGQAEIYAISYYSTAISLAGNGQYDLAIELLEKSLMVNPEALNLTNEINLISKTKTLDSQKENLFASKDGTGLLELGNNYYTLGNYEECINIFVKIISFDQTDAKSYNNLASCYAFLGKKEEAIGNYRKALSIDPSLDLAKSGLESLEK